ncbi:hypothetical protein B5M42_000380 [Paenibacillus athensensis]|uniref:Uncharacterized protein n=1 Tax=Paenibacillus athensensis TaxID=1967502 RepID=A0A4Y8Q7B0_9BACL|nr:hypothetical protein [Paenibacillus athensensis]MCD1257291.1 hypothetical protein [Paenibacillus athensensis]
MKAASAGSGFETQDGRGIGTGIARAGASEGADGVETATTREMATASKDVAQAEAKARREIEARAKAKARREVGAQVEAKAHVEVEEVAAQAGNGTQPKVEAEPEVTFQAGNNGDQSPKGDLLSCYTSAISSVMQRKGVSWELAVGTQLFMAVRPAPEAGALLSFMHYHTSLRNGLVRRTAATREEAVVGIVGELVRSGAVIIAGDTIRLPWTLACGLKHTPHWFVADGWDEAGRRIHLRDVFEFVDDQGEQPPYSGWVDEAQLAGLLGTSPYLGEALLSREQTAFGDLEDRALIGFERFQWFEAIEADEAEAAAAAGANVDADAGVDERGVEAQVSGAEGQTDSASTALSALQTAGEQAAAARANRELSSGAIEAAIDFDPAAARARLRDSLLCMQGHMQPVALAAAEWRSGLAAWPLILSCFAEHGGDERLYEHANDMWVAARTRGLFVHTLVKLGEREGHRALQRLAAWCAEALLPDWNALPRVMRYNHVIVQRGREPRSLQLELVQKLAALEAELVARLEAALQELEGTESAGIA